MLNPRNFALICSLSLTMAVPLQAETPPSRSVKIMSVDATGPACGPGSVVTNISDDGKAMTVLFDDYIVASDEFPGRRAQKSCDLKLGMQVPRGWTYGLFCVDFRGYADLDAGVKGLQTAKYSFPGQRALEVGRYGLQGPFADDYSHLTAVPLNQVSWAPCSDGSTKPLTINTQVNVDLPAPVALNHRRGRDLARTIHDGMARMYGQVRRHERSLSGTVKQVRELSHDIRREFDKRKPLSHMQWSFNRIKDTIPTIEQRINANGRLKNERIVRKELPKVMSAHSQLVAMLFPAPDNAQGLMTVDSVDGNLQHHYGVAWKRCDPNVRGGWVQADGNQRCKDVCRAKGKQLGRSPLGNQCVSGEVRPHSAAGKINFVRGCWPNCNPHNAQNSYIKHDRFCYQPGQTTDNDKTDRAVGCWCE